MNDITDISQLTGLQYNQKDIINQNIAASFIADYGIVTAVNDVKPIDVVHAVMLSLVNGVTLPTTETQHGPGLSAHWRRSTVGPRRANECTPP